MRVHFKRESRGNPLSSPPIFLCHGTSKSLLTERQVLLINNLEYQAYAREIKRALENLLNRLSIRFEAKDYDDDFHNACRRAASDRGISLDGDASIGPYIPLGVVIAQTAYAHLPSFDSRIYVALFTAALAAVEDLCRGEYGLLRGFCLRYWNNQKHGHLILDYYDSILRELPQRFEYVVADMMLQSNMDFVTSLVLEYDMQDRPVRVYPGHSSQLIEQHQMSSSAKGFPVFFRDMSGAAKIYSLLAYTRDLSLVSYVEVCEIQIKDGVVI